MLSEDLKDQRADVAKRFMTRCISLLESGELNENTVKLAEVLAAFISKSYTIEAEQDMVDQLKSLMRKAGHDIGRLE